MTVQGILDDLIAEQQALDDVVASLSEKQWAEPTPSPGWTIADQIAHLTYFDATAALAIRDTAAFIEHRAHLVELMADPNAVEAETMGPLRALTGDGLLSEWRANRRALESAGRSLAEDARGSYINRGLNVPAGNVSVTLTAPSGETWGWNQGDAQASVSGPAEDFCLVVTQRRHLDDTRLVTDGELARDWLLQAQAFAGGATDGPAAGTWKDD